MCSRARGGLRVFDEESTEPFAPLIGVHRTDKKGGASALQTSDTAIYDDRPSSLLLEAVLLGRCSSDGALLAVLGIEGRLTSRA